MRLLYCNLETVRLTLNGNFRKNHDIYIEKDACKICGEPYLAIKSRPTVFCSKACGKIGKKRKPFSEEHKAKISKSIRGKNHPFYGKHLSEEHRRNLRKPKTEEHRKKLSIIAKKRFKIKENHPNYKGGVREKNIPLYDTYAHQISYAEEVRRSPDNFNFLEVRCLYCNEWFMPNTRVVQGRLRVLNGKGLGDGRFYCSNVCKMACPVFGQHKYPRGFKKVSSREVDPYLRQICFERDNWTCQICGRTIEEVILNCHHIDPAAQNPMFQNDLDSVITLCKECHLKVHKLPGCTYYELRCKEEND